MLNQVNTDVRVPEVSASLRCIPWCFSSFLSLLVA